jgi:hypothetical protein
VVALEAAPVVQLLELFAGQREAAPARRLLPDSSLQTSEVRRADFVPTLDRYFYRAATLADLAIKGYAHLVV